MKFVNKKMVGVLAVTLMLVEVCSLFLLFKSLNNKEPGLDEVKLQEKKSLEMLAIMIEQEDGTYIESSDNSWPSDGYIYDSEKSGCIDINGNKIENSLTYDNNTNIVMVDTDKTSSCYVYFNKMVNLYDKIIEISPKGLVQEYALDNDNLYRFTSSTAEVDNYICLGSDACESGCENMYRIIGIEPNTKQIKVIKQTIFDTYTKIDATASGLWKESEAYSLLNETFYDSVSWNNLIVEHKWYVGTVASWSNKSTVFNAERASNIDAKIGLLSLTDYYMAHSLDRNWVNQFDTTNWLFIGNNNTTVYSEWTMSFFSAGRAWRIVDYGYINYIYAYESFLIRPTFYLSGTVTYKTGSGIITDPFIIN